MHADMAELADALDLGSSGFPVQVQVLLSAPSRKTPRIVRFEVCFFVQSIYEKARSFYAFYIEMRTELILYQQKHSNDAFHVLTFLLPSAILIRKDY